MVWFLSSGSRVDGAGHADSLSRRRTIFEAQSLAGSGCCREDPEDRSGARALILAAKGVDFAGCLSHPLQHHKYQGLVMSASSESGRAGGRPGASPDPDSAQTLQVH